MATARLAALALAAALPALAAAQPIVVTPAALQGWTSSSNATTTIGITATQPRGTAPQNTGSLELSGVDAAQAIRARYDLTVANPLTESFGALADLRDFDFDWYRAGTSTVGAIQAPAFRIYLRSGSGLGTWLSELVWEYTYNAPGAAPVDAWQSVATGQTEGVFHHYVSARLGSAGNQGATCNVGGANFATKTIGAWLSSCLDGRDAQVVGFGAGVGSIPGPDGQTFTGFVDNVSYRFEGQAQATVYNFETAVVSAVPEPSTYALMATGLLGVFGLARRRRAAGRR